MLKILTVFGTRPEVIKMAPVIKELRKFPKKFINHICVTAQHREMLDPLLELFGLRPDYDLGIMRDNQSLEHITVSVLNKVSKIIKQVKPDYLLVQGDTTTGMAASLAGFYQKVKIGHIEAGLRTGNALYPFPEEMNRKIIDSLGDLLFVHSEQAKQNLLREGIHNKKIILTGNTVIDSLIEVTKKRFSFKDNKLSNIPFKSKRIILVTTHRRDNFGQPLHNICRAIKEIALKYASDLCIVYPVHLNPHVQKTVSSLLGNIKNIILTEPLDYLSFVQLMKRSYFILTDSGGLQEEGPALGKPVLLLREVTERPEAVEAGVTEIVGTQTKRIIDKAIKLLEDKKKYKRMARIINLYGDGKAAKRIVSCLIKQPS